MISTINLCLSRKLSDPNEAPEIYYESINEITNYFFLVEAIVKIIALGFLFNGKHSYLRTFANVLDFVIVVCGMTGIILKG